MNIRQSLLKTLIYILHFQQRALLRLSFLLFYPIRRSDKSDRIVVGVDEIASLLHNTSEALENSVTVNTIKNQFYNYKYDYDFSKIRSRIVRSYLTPVLLAYLASKYNKFIYIGASGFLISQHDGRDYEFSFLNKLGVKIYCYFTGSDIRSSNLLEKYGAEKKIETIVTYQKIIMPQYFDTEKELFRKKLAQSADLYAEEIINAPVDQMSYIKRPTHPILYFFPDDQIIKNQKKWADLSKLVVVHAPSSPVIKGTQLVRAAVKKLEEEGFDFEYVELMNVNNDIVKRELKRAHIVLNQFYAFIPGVFGIEAMASNAAVMMSADQEHEKTLFPGANDAWVVTPYWRIYDNLKELLKSPEGLQLQADRGTDWVQAYCSNSSCGKYLKGKILAKTIF